MTEIKTSPATKPSIQLYTCKSCGNTDSGNFCSNCSNRLAMKRITLSGLLHEIFHLFTHLDRGFGYTFKKLITSPGIMQREYIEGNRAKHQKPFSMLFICLTVTAIIRYWIYTSTGDNDEANFFNEYMVIMQLVMLPLYVLITWLFFRTEYNYAETGVLVLYTTAMFMIMVLVISFLKLIWPEMNTAFIELPVIVVYNIITLNNFYNRGKRGLVIFNAILITSMVFLTAHYAEKILINILTN